MGTYEDDHVSINITTSQLKRQAQETELGFSSSGLNSQTERALVAEFQNVGLNSFDNDNRGGLNSAHNDSGGPQRLPLRPYAGDCPHYVRTGICKFGLTCKFNHPVKKTSLVVKDKDWSSDNAGQIECKYYSTAGGCKYGEACRYSHSKKESQVAAPKFNFLGLPMRLGGKECPYYMRNGSCGYGTQCVFHHPEPSSMGGLDLQKSSLNEASQPNQVPWSTRPLSSTLSYRNDYSSHTIANSVPQWMHGHSEFNECQAEEVPQQRSRNAHLVSGAARADMLEQDIPVQVEEFPERPGQPECAYFMKTGDCKFKSACRFHHPKGQPTCILSEKGLPLRPGRNICRHYERFGICKFGRVCLFDHPVHPNLSTFKDWPSSEPSGYDAGSWMQ
ncbi:zinc finger CCCH domain-containing protein 66-like isoform X2 [Coffea eugenioides]|uniref:zinc finger CCCH domain-containing protein 66-like isoform X2 n=1 Tax=Coffea eugenioides TaxID=49369 RepID=UPI000F6047D7|nr:zinc finger CCCH domain-containing protein 66-like isoform X2 [Coffea eugenioides]